MAATGQDRRHRIVSGRGNGRMKRKAAGLDEDPPVRSVHISFFTSDE